MREDYQFRHILGITGAAEKYKVRPGSVVTFLSERFQTKYEPKWQVLEIKVRLERPLSWHCVLMTRLASVNQR